MLVDEDFPISPARIAIVDRPAFLTWPHVERDGVLCLLTANASVSPSRPVDVVSVLLRDAVQLIERSIQKLNLDDFAAEFNTYWAYDSSPGMKPCLSLIDTLNPKSRPVAIWRGQNQYVVGDTESQVRLWMANSYGPAPKGPFSVGVLTWVDQPPRPDHYPKKARDLLPFVKQAPAAVLELINTRPQRIELLIASGTVNGTVLAGVSAPTPKHKSVTGREHATLNKGFRPGHVPPTLLLSRYFATETDVVRFEVQRCDHRWIHGRDRNDDSERLRESKVVVVGCGSLGAPAALQLAEAGVGSLALIDPDSLGWSNISRHVLGADAVGKNKATAMCDWLRRSFPHLEFTTIPSNVQDALRKHLEIFEACDLVISATGNWSATVFLNRALDCLERTPRTLFGWMERHASVGHCVSFLNEASGCIECGFNDTGVLNDAVTSWDHRELTQEPACGAQFDSYGASEATYCSSMICEAAVDILTGRATSSEHKFWVGPSSRIFRLGGAWTAYWLAHPEFRNSGGVMASGTWPVGSECACQESHATTNTL